MKRKTITVAFLAAVTVGMISGASAQTWNDNTTDTSLDINESDVQDSNGENGSLVDDSFNVDLAVTSDVRLDVKPERLNYPAVDIASRDVNSERNFTSVNLQNTGSEYIDNIWVDATAPDTDPFRQGTNDDDSTTQNSLSGSTHNAGNFIQIRTTEESGNLNNSIYNPTEKAYHFINRREFSYGSYDSSGNQLSGSTGQIPDFINADPSDMNMIDFDNIDSGDNPQEEVDQARSTFDQIYTGNGPNEVWVGTMRVADRDYYWALLSQQAGDPEASGNEAELRIADAEYPDRNIDNPIDSQVAYHDSDTFGAYDFTDEGAPNEPVRYAVYDIQTDGGEVPVGKIFDLNLRANANGDTLSWADGESVSGSFESRQYDVLVNQTSSGGVALTRTKFNPIPEAIRTTDGSDLQGDGGTAQYLFDATSGADMLQPGQSIEIDTAIEVPRGVVQGQVKQGTFSVVLTSDNAQTPGQTAEEFLETNQ